MPNNDNDSPSPQPKVVKGRFKWEDGKPAKDIWIYTDVPGNNRFAVANRWKTDAKGEGGALLENKQYNFYYTTTQKDTAELNRTVTEADCQLIKTGKARRGAIEVKLKQRGGNRMISLTFKSDHGKLKDNDSDWKNTGNTFPQPEWQEGRNHPITHTMDQHIEIEVEIELEQAGSGNLSGAGPNDLKFGGQVNARAGKSKHTLKSLTKLPKKIGTQDLDLKWCLEVPGNPVPLKNDTGPHKVYVTYDTPQTDMPKPEDGVTLKRMKQSVEWVEPMNTLVPHEIVNGMMKKYRYYVLYPSPNVPKKFKHPSYFNSEGGAWPMADYAEEYGECQAIVRIVRGVLRQLGVPGDAKIYTVWSEPKAGGGATTMEGDWEKDPSAGLDTRKTVNGKVWGAALVDGAVEVGKSYPASHSPMPGGGSSPGLNRYEACLRFEHGGVTKYYGGGAGVFANKDEVIKAFWALIWVSWTSNGGYKVEEIVQKYHGH